METRCSNRSTQPVCKDGKIMKRTLPFVNDNHKPLLAYPDNPLLLSWNNTDYLCKCMSAANLINVFFFLFLFYEIANRTYTLSTSIYKIESGAVWVGMQQGGGTCKLNEVIFVEKSPWATWDGLKEWMSDWMMAWLVAFRWSGNGWIHWPLHSPAS